MKPTRLFALMVVLFAAVSCTHKQPPETVSAGTSVSLALMKTLESGVDKEGDSVPFVVSQDVLGREGRVVIPKGTVVQGTVAWSRREGTLDAVMNRPARLTVHIAELRTPSGATISLSPERSLKTDEDYEFNRGNTGLPRSEGDIESALTDPKNDEAVKKLTDLIVDGKFDADRLSDEERERFSDLCGKLGLTKTEQLVRNRDGAALQTLIDGVRSGSGVVALANGGIPLALDALTEVASFASSLPSRLNRVLGGRNIKAYVGTPITVFVAKDAQG